MDFFISGWLTQYCWRETHQAWHRGIYSLSTTASSAKCLIRCASFPKSISSSFFFLMMWSCKKLFPHQRTRSLKHFFKALSPVWKSDDNRWVIATLHYQTVIKDLTLRKKKERDSRAFTFERDKCAAVSFRQGCRDPPVGWRLSHRAAAGARTTWLIIKRLWNICVQVYGR